MSDSEETLKQNDPVLQAIADLSKRFDERLNKIDVQLEVIREGLVHNSARFDQLEALAHDAKSIALINRSQLTILTEEIKQSKHLV
jgi:archaellum component FlaC